MRWYRFSFSYLKLHNYDSYSIIVNQLVLIVNESIYTFRPNGVHASAQVPGHAIMDCIDC